MRLGFAVTYYRPHVSGLTIYVERLAEALAERGHDVTVLTSRFRRDLESRERRNGVVVTRVPVAMRLSKGTIMPGYLAHALRLLRGCDAVIVNLPATPAESLLLPLAARLAVARPVVAVYHCDVLLPPGFSNRLVTAAVRAGNLLAMKLVRRVVAYTGDYASASRVLRRATAKCVVISPPVVIGEPDPARVAAWRRAHAADGERLIGFVARLASEKGVEVLLRALPAIRGEFGAVRVLFAGEHENVIGERAYLGRIRSALAEAGDAWRFLGVVGKEELPDLYAACDVTVLPSLNSTESFGLVQVESMLCGTPVVASDLPGVRVPVRTTGMGITVPPGDAEALAAAVVTVVRNRAAYLRPRDEVRRHFALERTVADFERLLGELARREAGRMSARGEPRRYGG
jgi:glycosyltransferase involved in cell wall biosynthesis